MTCPSCGNSHRYQGADHHLELTDPVTEGISDQFWHMPFPDLAKWIGLNARPGSQRATHAKAVYQFRTEMEVAEIGRQTAEVGAESSKRLVKATWFLVVATGLLSLVAAIDLLIRWLS